jgi:LacI family transcriptional regulator
VKKVRLQDIAELANVSAATVSRVVRDSGYVSQEKRRAVEKAMLTLGYVPAENTPPDVAPSSKVIGLLTQDATANILFPRLADSVNHVALANGYNVIVVNVTDEVNSIQLTSYVNTLRSLNACGVIFNALGDRFDFMAIRKFIANLPIPIVMIERAPDIFGVNKVLINAREGLFLVVQHLTRHGHRRIAFLGPDIPGREVETARINGFKSACEVLNCAETGVFLPVPDYGMAEGYRAIQGYLETNECPTAIIGADELLVGVGRFLYERGLRVPQHVSLVGLDDTLTRFSVPPLTSLAFPEREIAENAVNIILEAQKGKVMPKTILLSPNLVERASVARVETAKNPVSP